LRATVEFPLKFGSGLYESVRSEAKKFIEVVKGKVSHLYDDCEGYIILRQIKSTSLKPLQKIIALSSNKYIEVSETDVKFKEGEPSNISVERSLLRIWMEQYVKSLEDNDLDLFLSTNRCVAVQHENDFTVCDEKLLRRSFEEYMELKNKLPVPKIPLPKVNEAFSDILPLKTYNMLYNPRQYLTLGFGIDYIRELSRKLTESDGLFGAAVALYLTLGLSRLADFNSILTTWNHNTKTIRDSVGSYYKFRKFRLEGFYAEAAVTKRTLEWIYEPDESNETAGGICPVLKHLTEMLEDSGSMVETYLIDATTMSKWLSKELVDIMHIDPPYYDVHRYSDFSEFFWPILKTSLEPILNVLFPKDHILINWSPESWEVPRESEVIAKINNEYLFEKKLTMVFNNVRSMLKDDGLFIIWFNHKEMKAWDVLARAIKNSGFIVTAIIPLVSEHPTRSITKGGKTGFSRALAIVTRKKGTLTIQNSTILKQFETYIKEAKILPNEKISNDEIETLIKAATRMLKIINQ